MDPAEIRRLMRESESLAAQAGPGGPLRQTLQAAGDPTGTMANEAVEGMLHRENLLPFIGGTIGSVAVPGAGASLGALLSGLGAAGGSMVNTGVDVALGKPTGDPLATAAEAAVFQAVPEGLGRAGAGLLQKVIAPKAGSALTETLDTAREMRAALPPNSLGRGMAAVKPSSVNRSAFVQWLDRKAGQHNYGRDMLLAQDDYARKNLVDRMYANISDSIGADLSDEELGNIFVDTVTGNRDIARAPAVSIYNGIRDIASGNVVSLANTSPRAIGRGGSNVGRTLQVGGIRVNYDDEIKRPLLRTLHELAEPNVSTGYPQLDSFVRRISKETNQTKNFTEVWDERTKLREIMRGAEAVTDNKGVLQHIKSYGNRIEDAYTSGLENSLRQSPHPQLADWLRTADRIYAGATATHTPFEVNRLIQLVNDNHTGLAETIIQRIFGAQPGVRGAGVQGIAQIRRALTNPETGSAEGFETLQNWYVRSGLKNSIDERGQFSGAKLKEWVSKEVKNNRMPAVLSDRPETIHALQRLGKFEDFLRSGGKAEVNPAVGVTVTPDGGIGFTLMAAAGAGATTGTALGGLLGGFPGAAVGGVLGGGGAAATQAVGKMLLGGKYASKVAGMLLTNPASAKWLAEGAKLPAGSKAAFGTTARLLATASNMERLAEYQEKFRSYSLEKASRAEDMYQQMIDRVLPQPSEPELSSVFE